MSRAFVKEQDDAPEEVPERPVSSNPNFVTARGLRLIEAASTAAQKEHARAAHDNDKTAMARAARDLRYWHSRRASAQLVAPPPVVDAAAFATRVTIERADGKRQAFAIVGEDEADPARGLIAYVSPMARVLLGNRVGNVVEAPGGEVEILSLEAVDPEG